MTKRASNAIYHLSRAIARSEAPELRVEGVNSGIVKLIPGYLNSCLGMHCEVLLRRQRLFHNPT